MELASVTSPPGFFEGTFWSRDLDLPAGRKILRVVCERRPEAAETWCERRSSSSSHQADSDTCQSKLSWIKIPFLNQIISPTSQTVWGLFTIHDKWYWCVRYSSELISIITHIEMQNVTDTVHPYQEWCYHVHYLCYYHTNTCCCCTKIWNICKDTSSIKFL